MSPPPFDIELEVNRHGAALRRLAGELVVDRHTADDAVQQLWLDAVQQPPRHAGAVGGWLATALRNIVAGWRRSDRRRAGRESAVARARGEAAEDHAVMHARDELAKRVLAAVRSLDPMHRDVIWQRFFEGKAPREIAAAAGVPVETVKTRLKRALGTLRERLGEKHGAHWRAGLVAAFGLRREAVVTTAGVTAVATGAVMMTTATKGMAAVACAAAVIAMCLVWPDRTAATTSSSVDNGPAALVVAGSLDHTPPPAEVATRAQAVPDRSAAPTPIAKDPRLATIRGRCVDEHGHPTAGCKALLGASHADQQRVDAWLRDHPEPDWHNPPPQTTAADGAFEFTFWPPPPYQFVIRVDSDDFAAIGARWHAIAEGRIVDLGDIVMVAGVRVQGRVVDDAGTPIANTSVYVDLGERDAGSGDRETPSFCNTSGDTARDGTFRCASPVRPGPYGVQVSRSDGLHFLKPFTGTLVRERPVEDIVLVLQRDADGPAITGRVVDDAGQPVRDVLISGHDPEYGSCGSAKTRRDGTFRLKKRTANPGGSVWLNSEHARFEPARSERAYSWGSSDVALTMHAAGGLAVYARNENGTALADFTVRVAPRNANGWSSNDGDVRVRGPYAAGFATVPDIHRGSWTVVVEFPTATQCTSVVMPIEMTTNDTLRVDIVARGNARRTVRVVDSKGEPVAGTRVQVCLQIEGQFGADTFVRSIDDVFSVMSSAPMSRALQLMEATTAADGSVLVAGPRQQPLGIRVCGSGHVPIHRANVLLDDEAPLVIVVEQGARLHGMLRPATAVPELRRRAVGWELRLLRSGATPQRMLPATWMEPGLPIADDGSFDLAGVEPGEWKVVMAGSTLELGQVTLRSGEATRLDPDIAFVLPGVLQGTLHKNGAPLPGATVQFRGTVGRPFAYVQVTTDAVGHFELRAVADAYRAVLTGPEGADRTFEWPSLESAAVVAGQTTKQDFHVWTGELKVIVRDASGAPVPSLRVRVKSADGERTDWLRLTDAGGATDAEIVPAVVALAVLPKRLQSPEAQQQAREAAGAARGGVDPVDAMFMTVGTATVVTGKPTTIELRLPLQWGQ